MYIACPRCDWRPQPSDRWTCSCGYVWHTFDTHGVCPDCGKVWTETQCVVRRGCGQWSDHDDWYHDDDELTVEDYLANPHLITVPVPEITPINELLARADQIVEELSLFSEIDEHDRVDIRRIVLTERHLTRTSGHVIAVVPIGPVASFILDGTVNALESIFVHQIRVCDPVLPHPDALNMQRRQFRVSYLLDKLADAFEPDVFRVVGLIDAEIYVVGTNFVYGWHWPGGSSTIIGYRPFYAPNSIPGESREEMLCRRVAATVISQMRSMLGLGVCSTAGCAGNFSHSLEDTDQKRAWLCPDCRNKLAAWIRPEYL